MYANAVKGKVVMRQFAISGGLPHFYGKTGGYVVIYRGKDKNTTQGNPVFFEEPFWAGVFERMSEGKLSVCKVTSGREPKDYEIYDFVMWILFCWYNYMVLIPF